MNIIRMIYRILKKIITGNPLTVFVKKWEYNHRFAHAGKANLFKGVYETFNEAVMHAPDTKNIGYDHEEPSSMYRDRLNKVYPADYPVLYWLNRISKDNHRLFDLGGHIGITYYAYMKYLNEAQKYSWMISDVPSVTTAGERFATDKGETRITFTNDYKMGDGSDIVLASGSLQYIEEPLSTIINQYKEKPSHIIINLLPIYEGPTFVTLQNIGTVFCPYRIFNKGEFIDSFRSIGYELIDIWENAEKSLKIPFRPEKDLNSYHGMYFKKQL